VLPFTKRTVRSEEASELIKTGDIEVLPPAARANQGSSFPSPPPGRPRVFARSLAADDEMTTLLPRKGMTFSARPPAAVAPVPMPKLASSRPPRAMLEEPPTRQFVRPSAPPPSVSPVAGPPRSSNRPPPQLAQQHERAALKPQPVPVLEGGAEAAKSDPRIDPPATVVTARTRIVAARPTMSWAAALVAMGVFVGLVTAVVARGDADTLIDATASFVDPSSGHAAGAVVEGASVQTKAEEHRTTVLSTIDTLLVAEPAPSDAHTATVDSPTASPVPPRPAPVAYAAPVVHRAAVWHPAPRPAVAREEKEHVASNPRSTSSPKAAPATKSARASDDDVESASAADALAKAQLEASLR
jgi:hypothetical protein